MNLEPLTELEMYKREYSRLLRDNQRLISELNRVVTEKDELEHKYNNLQVSRLLFRQIGLRMSSGKKGTEGVRTKLSGNLSALHKNAARATGRRPR